MRNLKRALSLALASVMLLGMMVVGTNAGYKDVTSEDHLEAIEVMKMIGVMEGVDKDNFAPEQNFTRAQMAVVLCKLKNLPLGGVHPFVDVPEWADKYVAACYTAGLTKGVDATHYGSNDSVKTVDAALMLMKVLGYFEYQGEFDGDYQMATAKMASKVNLFKHVNSVLTQPVNRNELAQMVLNTLGCQRVIVKEQGGLNVEGNGISVQQKPVYTYETYDLKNATFGDFRFDGKLKKQADTHDDFGRPATKWTYLGEKVVAPEAPVFTFNGKMKLKDVSNQAGAGDFNAAEYYHKLTIDSNGNMTGGTANQITVNGTGTPLAGSTKDTKIGADGATTEVYYNKELDKVQVVVIDNHIGEVIKVSGEGADREITIKDLNNSQTHTLKTEDFARKDLVLYTTTDTTNVKTIELVGQKQIGKLTKTVGSDLYIDGNKVPVSRNAKPLPALKINDTVEYLVDQTGAIVKMDVVKASVSLNNVAYVESVASVGGVAGNYEARLVLPEGKEVIVRVENGKATNDVRADSDSTVNLYNTMASYTVDANGVYTLDKLTDAPVALNALVAKYENGKTKMDSVKLDKNTVFVYNTLKADGSHDSYTVYTGYAAAPTVDVDSSTKFSAMLNSDGIAEYVYVEAKSTKVDDSSVNKVWSYIAYNANVKETNLGDNNKFYEYKAVVDGEVTTVKVKAADIAGNTNKIGKSIAYNDKGVMKDFVVEESGTATHATELKVNVNGGVIDVNENGTTKLYNTMAKDLVVIEVAKDGSDINVITADALNSNEGIYKNAAWTLNSDQEVVVLVVTLAD